MDSANRYLQDDFIPSFWSKHIEVMPRNGASEFTPVPEHIDLDDIFIVKDYHKIRSDHTFSYDNKFYLIESPLKHSIAKQKIEIRTGLDDNFIAYFAGRHLSVSEVIEPTKLSMFDLEIQRKLEVLELAEKLQNVSEAARISGISRDTIYRHRIVLRVFGRTECYSRSGSPSGIKDRRTVYAARERAKGKGIRRIASELGIGVGTVQRVVKAG